jgi:hypothetical protein
MLMAFDRSARSKDVDGHLRVEHCKLTEACVSPYTSDDLDGVPGAERLDLSRGAFSSSIATRKP